MDRLVTYLVAYAILLSTGLIVLRYLARRDYRKVGNLTMITALMQVAVWFMYGGFPIIYLPQDWPAVQVKVIFHVLGLALIIIGLGFLLYTIHRLGLLRSLGRGEASLLVKGLYGRTRNPQALACALYVAGFTLLWPSWQALAWALLYPILIHIMIVSEEEHLLNEYGESYVNYCQQVPRYVAIR